MFLHLNTINKQFIWLRFTEKSSVTVLFCLFKLLHLLLSSFQNFSWKVEGPVKFQSFFLLAFQIGHNFFTLRILQKTCDNLSRFTIGRNTLSNMDPLEFDLVCIFHTKLCFKESNQTSLTSSSISASLIPKKRRFSRG